MKDKSRGSRLPVLILLLALLVAGGVAKLMTTDIPGPGKPVEKPLDAKAFLGQKQ
ncbi:MAG: hypothetical protein KGJ06_05425 [Pseudomonadota bacterium]|nr:hypothetical protein [Pseudomonadota bacterium]